MFLPLISFGQQTGDLDLSFSIDGMQTVSTSNSLEVCRAIAIQSDGKIVAVGSSNNGAKKQPKNFAMNAKTNKEMIA